MTPETISSITPAGDSLVLDTSAVIAYLVGDEPVSWLATAIMDGLVATERDPAMLSAVSVRASTGARPRTP